MRKKTRRQPTRPPTPSPAARHKTHSFDHHHKARLFLSGALFTLVLVYLLLYNIASDNQVGFESDGVTYLVALPGELAWLYLLTAAVSFFLSFYIFYKLGLSLKEFLHFVVLRPGKFLATDDYSKKVFAATTSILVGATLLGIVPLVSNPAFPSNTSPGLGVFGVLFFLMGFLSVKKFL